MSTVNTSFYDNPFKAVHDTYYKLGMIKDGTILPKSDTVSDKGYELQKLLMIQSSITENAVATRFKKIFTKEPERAFKTKPETDVKYIDAFINNVDNTGQNMSEFSYEYMEKNSLYDFDFIVMDDYQQSEKSTNPEEMIKRRQFPFFETIDPTQVVVDDYTFDNKGKLIKFSYRYETTDDDGAKVERIKTIDTESITIYDASGDEQISSVAHAFYETSGEIPVRIVKSTNKVKNSKLLDSTPSIMNVVRTSINTMILDVVADYSAHNNCLNQFVMAADKALRAEIRDKGATVNVGNQSAIFVDPNYSTSHSFLAPQAGNIDQIRESNQVKIKRALLEEGMKYTESASAESGYSKSFDQEQINTNLGFNAYTAEETEKWIVQTFCNQMGIELVENTIVYQKEYGIDAVADQIDSLFKFYDMIEGKGASDAEKETLKAAAMLLFDNKPLENVKESIDGIIDVTAGVSDDIRLTSIDDMEEEETETE